MGRQSCAIGACSEKSYKKSAGVKFFNLKWIKDETIKRAWKKKILATRDDLKSEDQLNDVAICSRHFVDGDKRNLPTIIPRMIDGVVVWPKMGTERRLISRRNLTFPNEPSTHSPSQMDIDESGENEPCLTNKLKTLKDQMLSSPPKVVKEIEKKKHKEIDCLSPLARTVYQQMTETTPVQLTLTQKLKILQEKKENEPNGVKVQSTPVSGRSIKDDIIANLKKCLDEERERSKKLRYELEECSKMRVFGVDRFKGNPCDFNFYTGLPDYMSFLALLDLLQPDRYNLYILYYQSKPTDDSYVNQRGRDEILSVHDQLFLVLSRLRQGYKELDLAHRFSVSVGTVSRIFSKWIKHMAHILDQLPIWPSKELVDKKLPQAFRDLEYGNTRCIIDCTEVFIQQPSSNLALQSVLFSSYKNHHTAKGLVAIAPHGPVVFASDLYVGSASDYDIFKDCGLLELLEPGDHLMADKGFEIQKLLDNKGIRVDHPPILRGVAQMSSEQETKTRRIAKLRIHVERAIERIKNFRILQDIFPQKQWRLLSDIWKCCTKLVLLQPPLIEEF